MGLARMGEGVLAATNVTSFLLFEEGVLLEGLPALADAVVLSTSCIGWGAKGD